MRNFAAYNWLTIILLLNVSFLLIAKYINPKRFSDFIEVFLSSRYLKVYEKSLKLFDAFNSVLYINAALASSVFLCYIFEFYFDITTFNVISIIPLFCVTLLFFLLKKLLIWLLGILCQIKPLLYGYLFQKITFKAYTGILLVVFNLLLIYSSLPKNSVIIACFIIVFSFNLMGFVNSLKRVQKYIYKNFIYFLLYLCTLEILPYIVMFAVLKEVYNF